MSWKEISQGSGAMGKALAKEELDVALMLTEGAVFSATKQQCSILGT